MGKRTSGRSGAVAQQASGSTSPGAPEPTNGLLASLGIHGLAQLDAPVLAALASETPMLLIGPHGSAKSAMLERLAATMGLEHRHYNASLLSFDDLVGFPVPEGDGLRYLRTPATLWGAQSVFLDEISRCRPEVQNKLFSIVHERRLQGMSLDELRYRWAAMNPPATSEPDDEEDAYVGSVPLDPALADRFGFVIMLPAIEDLAPEARRRVIRSGLVATVPGADSTDLPSLVDHCRRETTACASRHADWITAYTSALLVPLRQAGRWACPAGAQACWRPTSPPCTERAGLSATRARAPKSTARIPWPTRRSSRFATPCRTGPRASRSMPAWSPWSTGRHSTRHRKSQADPELGRILDEPHPVRRVGQAVATLGRHPGRIARHTMSMLVADALASQDKQGRWILSQELLPTLAGLDCVDAPTLELLAEPFMAQVSFETRSNLRHEVRRSRVAPFNALVSAVEALDVDDPRQVALGNLGAALYANDEGASDPAALVRQQSSLQALLDATDGHAR